MKRFNTIKREIYYTNVNDTNGPIDSIQPFEKIELQTTAGPLVPIYEVEDHGRKKLSPVRLYPSGKIKSIALQQATEVPTSIGLFSAELVTFYESGAVARVFQLNGKLSGYWSEANEYKLAQEVTIITPIGILTVRPLYVHFYETGELKSITFWPREQHEIKTPIGKVTIKKGLSFHKNGALASCEPVSPLVVNTPLGPIDAYDPDPMGMNGESNSLAFTESGDIAGLSTISTAVMGTDPDNNEISFSPLVQRSRCSDTAFSLEPLKVKFQPDAIIFRNGLRPKKTLPADSVFKLKPFQTDKPLAGESCSA